LLESEIILKDGIDISLQQQDKMKVYNDLKEIIGCCSGPLQLIDENKFVVSDHVVLKRKSELKERGFSSIPTRLQEEIATIIYFSHSIEKAKLHFDRQHLSKASLSFTLNAPLGNKTGRIAISFKREYTNEEHEGRVIMVVTVLSLK
jgi:hypothetical protein